MRPAPQAGGPHPCYRRRRFRRQHFLRSQRVDLEALASLPAVETGLMIGDDGPGDQQIQEGRQRAAAMRGRRGPSH